MLSSILPAIMALIVHLRSLESIAGSSNDERFVRLDFRDSVQLSARVRGTHRVDFNQVNVLIWEEKSIMFTNFIK